jgi:hypothetical protein
MPAQLPPADQTSKQPRRRARDYKDLTHVKTANQFRTEVKKGRPGHRLIDFLTKGFFTWIFHTIKSGFRKKHPYSTYGKDGFDGIYPIGTSSQRDRAETLIAIAGDWATDTAESFAVGARMARHKPEYTIHLGDTYFVGAPLEIAANFLPVGNSPWPRGTVGSFALIGNHEMYTRGVSYFKDLLITMGAVANGVRQTQQGPFFCLENDHWRIVGLDTGYNSVSHFDFGTKCDLQPEMMDWLRQTIAARPKKALLILSHHQYITAFAGNREYPLPAERLAGIIGKDAPVIWLWGHEHKFAIYEKAQVGEGVTAYGRCIGHGGMPIELDSREFVRSDRRQGTGKLVAVDTRSYPNTYNEKLGFNGYALVRLAGDRLTIEYHDVHKILLTEIWRHTGDGVIAAEGITGKEADFVPEPGKTWADAIK